MSTSAILEQIRSLATEEKRKLVESIWDEFGDELGWVDPNPAPEQLAELDRRLAEFEKNPGAGIPWEQVEAEMNERFGWK